MTTYQQLSIDEEEDLLWICFGILDHQILLEFLVYLLILQVSYYTLSTHRAFLQFNNCSFDTLETELVVTCKFNWFDHDAKANWTTVIYLNFFFIFVMIIDEVDWHILIILLLFPQINNLILIFINLNRFLIIFEWWFHNVCLIDSIRVSLFVEVHNLW